MLMCSRRPSSFNEKPYVGDSHLFTPSQNADYKKYKPRKV